MTVSPRVRGYSILLAGAGAAGLLGAAFDQVTVMTSPEYFTVGKGLAASGLREQVAWLGFRSGLPLGALVAGLGLVCGRAGSWAAWRRWLAPVVVAACGAPPAAAVIMVGTDPFGVRSWSAWMSPAACERYLMVWGLHAGVYLGVAAGLAVAIVRARRARGRCATGGRPSVGRG